MFDKKNIKKVSSLEQMMEIMVNLQVPMDVCLEALLNIREPLGLMVSDWESAQNKFQNQYKLKKKLEVAQKKANKNCKVIEKKQVIALAINYLSTFEEKLEVCLISKEYSKTLRTHVFEQHLLTHPILPKMRFKMWKFMLSEVTSKVRNEHRQFLQ